MNSDPPRESREPGVPTRREAGAAPLHDDEQTALVAVYVLVHVEDAHDVGAAGRLPVLLHLLPGLGAVVQDLEAAQTASGWRHPGQSRCGTPQRGTEAQGGRGPVPGRPAYGGHSQGVNPGFPGEGSRG